MTDMTFRVRVLDAAFLLIGVYAVTSWTPIAIFAAYLAGCSTGARWAPGSSQTRPRWLSQAPEDKGQT